MNRKQQATPPNGIGHTTKLWGDLGHRPKPLHYVIAAVIVVMLLLAGWVAQDWIVRILNAVFVKYPAKSAGVVVFLLMGILGLIAGIFSALVLRSYLSDLPATTSRMESHFNEWVRRANGVMSEAARAALKEMSLTLPWEYINFIGQVDREYEEANPRRHIERITLYGTMVGFAFLLPEAIRNQACRAAKDFRTLEVVASDAVIDVANAQKHLVLYPLWLTASVVNELLFVCKSFPKHIKTPMWSFSVEIAYVPFDLMGAAIYLPRRIAVTQALDHKGLLRVLEEGKLQVGFFYNDTDKRDEYDRYVASIRNQVTVVARKKEVWKLSSNEKLENTLVIANPHWVKNTSGSVMILRGATDYDSTPTGPVELVGETGIRGFLSEFKDVITATESAGGDIRDADPIAQKAKDLWAHRYSLQCPCCSAPSLPPEPGPRTGTAQPVSGETNP